MCNTAYFIYPVLCSRADTDPAGLIQFRIAPLLELL